MEYKKYISTIAKILRKTQDNELAWEIDEHVDFLRNSGEYASGPVYETNLKGQRLRLYVEKEKYWLDEEKYEWTERIVLALVDSHGNNHWVFPQVQGINNLYDAVSYQTADVASFVNSVLDDDL